MIDDATLKGRLRASKPVQLRVYVTDRQEAQLVALSNKRDRWAKVLVVLSELDWHRIECLDRTGATVDIITDEEAAAGDDGDARTVLGDSDEERLLAILINGQRLALENVQVMLQPLIDGYIHLANALGSRLSALESHYDRTLRVAHENALLAAKLENSGGEDAELVELAKVVLRGGAKRTKATNGKSNGVHAEESAA